MIISVLNHTNGKIQDAEMQKVVRAVNRQIEEDFYPYWGMNARLRLEGKSSTSPDPQSLADMRGDAVLYLWSDVDVDNALGYHDQNNAGVPYGFIFTELCKQLKESWTVTLSHEALELIADPEANLLVQGPHPDPQRKGDIVFHWYEMCDAVQGDTYWLDGVEVSNFVLPLYFTASDEVGGRNDFLGSVHKRKTLRSFGVNPGGYVGFFDPKKDSSDTFSLRGDAIAQKRRQIKAKAMTGRRLLRQESLQRPDRKHDAHHGRKAQGRRK